MIMECYCALGVGTSHFPIVVCAEMYHLTIFFLKIVADKEALSCVANIKHHKTKASN